MTNAELVLLQGVFEREEKTPAFFYCCHEKSQLIVTGYFLKLRYMLAKSLLLCKRECMSREQTEVRNIKCTEKEKQKEMTLRVQVV